MNRGFSAEYIDDKVHTFVQGYLARVGYPPTQREIALGIDVSVATVNRALWRLHEAGLIEIRPGGQARTLRVTGTRMETHPEAM